MNPFYTPIDMTSCITQEGTNGNTKEAIDP